MKDIEGYIPFSEVTICHTLVAPTYSFSLHCSGKYNTTVSMFCIKNVLYLQSLCFILMDLCFIEQGKVLCEICYLGRREQPGFSQLS